MKMTKFACLALAMGVAVFTTTSCKKSNDQTTMTVIMGEWEEDDDTRMYIDFDNGRAYWNGDDEVMVYNLKIDNSTKSSVYSVYKADASAEGKHTAHFTGPNVGPKKDLYFTFYPAQIAAHSHGGALDENNRETFIVPAVQYLTTYQKNGATKNTLDPMALVQAKNPESLQNVQFENIFGTLRIGLVGDEGRRVDHIEVIDNEHNLTGTISLKLHAVNTQNLNTLLGYFRANQMVQFAQYYQQWIIGDLGYNNNFDDHTKMVTLDCSVEPTQSVFQPNYALEVYFGLRPGALADGFKVKIYLDNDEAYYIDYPANHNKCIRPGVIRTIRPVYLTPENYRGTDEIDSYGWCGTWAEIAAM
jgi:hypothetical protein